MRSPLPLHRHSWNVPWHHVMLWCVMGLVTEMQTVWSQAERISHWSTWMQGEHPDLTAAFEGFQSQAEYRTSPRSTGEKPFLRWAWWMTERLAPLGASDVWIDPSNSDHVCLHPAMAAGTSCSLGLLETVDGGSTWSHSRSLSLVGRAEKSERSLHM